MDLILIGAANFCTSTANIWQLVGIVLLIFKIAIPIILIVMGMIDLGKAVVASKSDEVKKSITSLAMRAVAAVVIFLIPTLVSFIMGFVAGFNNDDDLKNDFEVCKNCIVKPYGGLCDGKAHTAWGMD